MSFPFTVQ